MRKAFLQLHLAVFLAGFTGVLGRIITLNEAVLVWWRLLITASTMWLLFLPARRVRKISARDHGLIFLVGIIAALHWVSFYGAIKYANISVALVCFSAVGFFTAIVEPVIFKTRFKPSELLLGLLVMAGIYIIFQFDPRYKTGIVIGLISAFLGAVFPVCNRRLLQRMNAETLLSYELTAGFLVLSFILPFYIKFFNVSRLMPGKTDWVGLLFLSWICSVWAFQLSANALKKISAFTVNLTYNLEPVYGIVLAFVIYHENEMLGPSFYVGLSLILIAVSWQTIRVYRHRKAGLQI